MSRSLFFTSQGFRSQEIEIAPDISAFDSKRRPLIEQENNELDLNLNELDVGTKARNRAFQDRLDEVWHSTEGWEAKLRTEAKEAANSILNMKDEYQRHIETLTSSLMADIDSIFDKFDKELIVTENARVAASEAENANFFKVIVPDRIEKQSGEVSRQLRRQYETFDIEKKKELKRETKLVEKASKHMQSTAQRFEDEDALLSSCFFTLEEDVVEYERHAARMQLLKNLAAVRETAELHAISTTESDKRTAEDKEVLDTVIETQKLLQQTILEHFGSSADSDGAPSFGRLNKRMNRIAQKQKAAEVEAAAAAEKAAAEEAEAAAALEAQKVAEAAALAEAEAAALAAKKGGKGAAKKK